MTFDKTFNDCAAQLQADGAENEAAAWRAMVIRGLDELLPSLSALELKDNIARFRNVLNHFESRVDAIQEQ